MPEEERQLHVVDLVKDTLTKHRSRKLMETKLARIAEIAKERPKEVFTSLYHHINEKLLLECHKELDGSKAVGIDQVTKEEYQENINENIKDLVDRLKKHSYKPQPVKRVYIDKERGKKRPLGIASYEDKILQLALKKILEPIYEADFLDISYGFRPGRSCHDALRALNKCIERGKINYIVDADIKGFFDHVDHKILMEFVGNRIADPNIKRLIMRFLRAGIIENGERIPSEEGTPQGSIISPLLANIYLHYVLDTWFQDVVKVHCNGQADIVRYADDFVCCFEYEIDAKRFYKSLIGRLAKYNLEIAEEKTKIIPFGRNSAANCVKMGMKKSGTFDFLGFTHRNGKSKAGRYRVKRKTSSKKFKVKVKEFKMWIMCMRNLDSKVLMYEVNGKLKGHYQYYGITDNYAMLNNFKHTVERLLYKWLNRRSQRRSFSLDKFGLFIKRYPLLSPRTYVSIYG